MLGACSLRMLLAAVVGWLDQRQQDATSVNRYRRLRNGAGRSFGQTAFSKHACKKASASANVARDRSRLHQQTVTDGITSETETIISAPRSRSELREDEKAIRALVAAHSRVCTFNGRVADLERTCRHTLGLGHGRQQRPAFGSRAWHAEEVLRSLQVVRDALARDDSQLASSEAVVVGALAAAAETKFHGGACCCNALAA